MVECKVLVLGAKGLTVKVQVVKVYGTGLSTPSNQILSPEDW